jgi:uncharacterized protein (TIGR03086 family)
VLGVTRRCVSELGRVDASIARLEAEPKRWLRRWLIRTPSRCGQDLSAVDAMVRDMEPTTTITDPRPHFVAATETLRDIVAGIDPSQFDRPTPCTGMNVRELIDHASMAVGRVAAAGRGAPLEEWPTEGSSVGDDVDAALATLIEDATSAWSDDRLTEQIVLPWTTLSGADTMAVYVNEILVHSWDLARATGQDPTFDDGAIAVAEAIIHHQLPDAARGPMWEAFKAEMPEGIPFEAPFADAAPVPEDAPPIVRLVAWNGRQP